MLTDEKLALVVENEQVMGRMLSYLFMSRGLKVTTAINGIEAFEKIEQKRPDIIILDLMMPGMDGFEFCEKIKKDPKHGDIPVVIVSALPSSSNRTKLLSMGAVEYIQKPFDSSELVNKIEEILSKAS
ncbi:MAG: response regulator [Deltaproteobacteria bacterium]|nr:response regulator [Deltaproteobacteria bacterium]